MSLFFKSLQTENDGIVVVGTLQFFLLVNPVLFRRFPAIGGQVVQKGGQRIYADPLGMARFNHQAVFDEKMISNFVSRGTKSLDGFHGALDVVHAVYLDRCFSIHAEMSSITVSFSGSFKIS